MRTKSMWSRFRYRKSKLVRLFVQHSKRLCCKSGWETHRCAVTFTRCAHAASSHAKAETTDDGLGILEENMAFSTGIVLRLGITVRDFFLLMRLNSNDHRHSTSELLYCA